MTSEDVVVMMIEVVMMVVMIVMVVMEMVEMVEMKEMVEMVMMMMMTTHRSSDSTCLKLGQNKLMFGVVGRALSSRAGVGAATYGSIEMGALPSVSKTFALYMDKDKSFWHDVEALCQEGEEGEEGSVINMVAEIPRGYGYKMEVQPGVAGNPIAVDSDGEGNPRVFKYGEGSMPFHYGAMGRTWEDPEEEYESGLAGDGDPLDVVDISLGLERRIGQVVPLSVLGILGLIDQGELDYKVVGVDVNLARQNGWRTVDDLPQPIVAQIVDWFVNYKTAEGKGVNDLLWDGRIEGPDVAARVIAHAQLSYDNLVQDPGRMAQLGMF